MKITENRCLRKIFKFEASKRLKSDKNSISCEVWIHGQRRIVLFTEGTQNIFPIFFNSFKLGKCFHENLAQNNWRILVYLPFIAQEKTWK